MHLRKIQCIEQLKWDKSTLLKREQLEYFDNYAIGIACYQVDEKISHIS